MKRVIPILLFVAAPAFAWGEDIFIAHSALGTNTGSSCASAHSIQWFNTALNWGAGFDKVSPGDTVHLCNTINDQVNVQASGTSDNAITILFENGAKLSKPTWGDGGAAILISGKNYIVINGGTNGVIEATNNGTALATQHDNKGVLIKDSTHIEVSNLRVINLYVRIANSSDNQAGSNGIRIDGSSQDIKIHNNVVSFANGGVYFSYAGAARVEIFSNDISHGANGIVVGSGTVGATGDDIKVYSNRINLYNDWSGTWGSGDHYHNDGIQCFAVASGSLLTNLKVFGNTIGPAMGEDTATTGWIFVEGYISSPKIFNNLLLVTNSTVNTPTNGFIYDKPMSGFDKNTEIYNNTIVSEGKRGNGVAAEDAGVIIKNNILMNLNYAIYSPGGYYSNTDYNSYYNNGTNGHSDLHGVTANPYLDSAYKPTTSSSILDRGVNLSTFFTTDKDGTLRPMFGAWEIGAFELSSSTSKTPNAPTQLIVSGN